MCFQEYKWPWQNKPKETKTTTTTPKTTTTQRPVDCLWGSWSTHIPCSTTCGQGTEWVRRRIVREAKNGGRECMGTDHDAFKQRACSIRPCPGLSNITYYFVKVMNVPPSCLAQVCNPNKNMSFRLPESELRTTFSNILLRLSHGSHWLGWRRLVPW